MALTQISTDGIKNGTITTADLADDAVNTSKIAGSAITSAKIADGTIVNADIADNTIRSAKILNGTLLNADINASAAIAGTKISPDFGNQSITTTGGITGSGLTSISNININNDSPSVTFNDTNSENDFRLTNSHGTFILHDNDAGATRMSCTSAGQFTFATNVDFSSGIDVTGNITVTGTVDGVDIATRDTLFGGLTSSSGVLTNGVTATTQSASDNSTKVATTAYTDTAIANLIDSSPGTLNTLNELAAALGDDASFSTTVTNSIATKLPLAGGTLTGKLTIDTNTTNMLELKPTNSSPWVISINRDDLDQSRVFVHNSNGLGWVFEHLPKFYDGGAYRNFLHTGSQGSGNGLDADTVDGIEGANFLRSDTADTTSGDITFSGGAGAATIAANSDIRFTNGNWTGNSCKIQQHGNSLYIQGGSNSSYNIILRSSSGNDRLYMNGDGDFYPATDSAIDLGTTSKRFSNGYFDTLYGDGSNITGVNATTLDSIDSGSFLRSDANDTATGNISIRKSTPVLTLDDTNTTATEGPTINFDTNNNQGVALKHVEHDGDLPVAGYGLVLKESDANTQFPSSGTLSLTVLGTIYAGGTTVGSVHRVLTVADEGSGNGIDADTLDGVDGANYVRTNQNTTITSDLFIGGGAGGVTVNAGSDIRFSNGDWTGNVNGTAKIQHHNNFLYISGGTSGIIFRENNDNRWVIDGSGHFRPGLNNTYDIGTTSQRVRNIYTNDLNLSNEGGMNDVDGTWGSYTIQEGEESLFLINKRNGKKYKFNLTEVS